MIDFINIYVKQCKKYVSSGKQTRVSAIFLINETATVIYPCINIRKKDTYYIYLFNIFHCTSPHYFLVYIVEFTRKEKTEGMNKGDAWTMEWTKDTYATCCVKWWKWPDYMMITFVSWRCYECCIYKTQFNLKYVFMFNSKIEKVPRGITLLNRQFKSTMQNSFT